MVIDFGNIGEAELVNNCKANNAAAQKALYTTYADEMMMVCLRYIANREDAREVLMDGFLNFFKGIGGFTYRGEGSVRAWLKKIMINQCLMHLRKRQLNFVSSETAHEKEGSNDGNALDTLTVKEIIKTIHSLPEGCRAVFNLYVFEGMSHAEIGGLLDISESTSKSQLHRARVLLQEKLLKTSKTLL